MFVKDFCSALVIIIKKINKGIYNVGTKESYSNIQIAKKICNIMGKPHSQIKFTKDRAFNDRRYSISSKKISKLGWRPRTRLFNELKKITEWYKFNRYLFDRKIRDFK